MRHLVALALAIGLSLGSAPVARAEGFDDAITRSLETQGFDILLVHWTLLGRIRIVAETDDLYREIVINPGTGEILRDYSTSQEALAARLTANRRSERGSPSDIDETALTALDMIETRLTEPLGPRD